MKENINFFSSLTVDCECKKCGNHGNMTKDCENQSSLTISVENGPIKIISTKIWKKNSDKPSHERCNFVLHVQNKKGQWYIDNGCSKHT